MFGSVFIPLEEIMYAHVPFMVSDWKLVPMQLDLSDLNLIYACTKEKTLMIDVQAREISERDLEVGIRLAHPEVSWISSYSYFFFFLSTAELIPRISLISQAVKCLEPQIRLAAKAGKHKKEYKLSMVTDKSLEKIGNIAEAEIAAVFSDASYGKVHGSVHL